MNKKEKRGPADDQRNGAAAHRRATTAGIYLICERELPVGGRTSRSAPHSSRSTDWDLLAVQTIGTLASIDRVSSGLGLDWRRMRRAQLPRARDVQGRRRPLRVRARGAGPLSEGIRRLAGSRRRVRTLERIKGLPFGIALVAYAAAFAVMRPAATGDEPHYLLAAQSLVRDGDFDLRNDYASAERVLAVHDWFPLDSHATASGYPGHNVGLSVFLAPAYWLGGTLAARALVITAAALLAHQLYRLLEQLDPGPLQARRLAWAGIVLTLPLAAYSNQFYAEMLGALLTIVAVRVLVARERRRRPPAGRPISGAAPLASCSILTDRGMPCRSPGVIGT